MKQGYSFKAFAGLVGVNRDTLYEWEKKFPEFAEAKEIGTEMALYSWEQLAMKGLRGEIKGFSVGTFVFNMKNRFGWRDKQELEVTGKGGRPLNPLKPITPQELQAALAMDAFTVDVTPQATLPAAPEVVDPLAVPADDKKPKG